MTLTRRSPDDLACLVACPRCGRCARLTHRVSCRWCGYASWPPREYRFWLRTPCCGHTLWAYTAEHLAAIERYVAAPVRRRPEHWPHRGYGGQLPAWLLSAKNRAHVLRGVEVLKARLADADY